MSVHVILTLQVHHSGMPTGHRKPAAGNWKWDSKWKRAINAGGFGCTARHTVQDGADSQPGGAALHWYHVRWGVDQFAYVDLGNISG